MACIYYKHLKNSVFTISVLLLLQACGASSGVSSPDTPPASVVTQSSSTQSSSTSRYSHASLVNINSLAMSPLKIAGKQASANTGNFDLSRIEDEIRASFRAASNAEVIELAQQQGGPAGELDSADTAKLLSAAKRAGADGLLIAELQSFSQRSGSSIGSDKGAEFGVAVRILDVVNGQIVWEANYNEKDSAGPLINITGGHMKRPEFRSIDKLIKEGCSKLAEDFAAARMRAFAVK